MLATSLDVNFDQFVAQHIPNVNLTAGLECSPTVTERLHEITGHRARFAPANGSSSCGGSGSAAHAARRPARPPARPPCWPTRARCRRSARRPNSPTPSAGSTRPATSPLTLASLRGQGRARGLLDLHLHQLHPHAALPEGLGRRLPARRPDDRRRRDARVLLRARRRQRGERDPAVRPPLPGRPGQRNGHLERLRQRVLARRLPDRRPRPGALRELRRGRLRQDRNGDPGAAGRRPGAQVGAHSHADAG